MVYWQQGATSSSKQCWWNHISILWVLQRLINIMEEDQGGSSWWYQWVTRIIFTFWTDFHLSCICFDPLFMHENNIGKLTPLFLSAGWVGGAAGGVTTPPALGEAESVSWHEGQPLPNHAPSQPTPHGHVWWLTASRQQVIQQTVWSQTT